MDTELKEAIVIGIGIACLLWLVKGTATETKKRAIKKTIQWVQNDQRRRRTFRTLWRDLTVALTDRLGNQILEAITSAVN